MNSEGPDFARALLTECPVGVLATMRRNGLPQLSPVMPHFDQAGNRLLIASQDGLAKVRNLRRTPWAALEVTSADLLRWVTVEGVVTIVGPPRDPASAEAQALVDYFRAAAGEHPDWDEYRQVMVEERRVLVALSIDHLYGQQVDGLS